LLRAAYCMPHGAIARHHLVCELDRPAQFASFISRLIAEISATHRRRSACSNPITWSCGQ
jgi:hypothetical protein